MSISGRHETDLIMDRRTMEKARENRHLLGFFNYMSAENFTASSKRAYVYHIADFLSYVDKSLVKIGLDDILAYLNEGRYAANGMPVSNSYYNCMYFAVKKFFRYLTATGYVKKDPMRDFDKPKTAKDAPCGVYLTEDELRVYLHNLYTPSGRNSECELCRTRDIAMILIFLNTGARLSAVKNLNTEDVNFDSNIIHVEEKERKHRYFEVSDEVMKAIGEYLPVRERWNSKKTSALFLSSRGQRISDKNIRDVVREYARGIPKKITPHKLRATFATIMYDKTLDLTYVQHLMGHSKIDTTTRYIRGKAENTRVASEMMTSLIAVNK